MAPKHRAPRPDSSPEAAGAFPSTRYFQLHFEHLQQLLGHLGQQLDATRHELAAVKAHLGLQTEPESEPAQRLATTRRRRHRKTVPACHTATLPQEDPASHWSTLSGEG